MKKTEVGEVFTSNEGETFRIVDVYSYEHALIEFDEYPCRIPRNMKDIRVGSVKNPCRPSVEGVGFSGIGGHPTGNKYRAHAIWNSMLGRCYGNRAESHMYEDVVVCTEWHNYQNFADWYDDTYIPGMTIDKDLLTDLRIYSPNTCLWIPRQLNLLILCSQNTKGYYLHGTNYRSEFSPMGCKKLRKMFKREEHAKMQYRINKYRWAYFKLHNMDVEIGLKNQLKKIITMRLKGFMTQYPEIVFDTSLPQPA